MLKRKYPRGAAMDLSQVQKLSNLIGIPLLAGTNIFITIAAIGAVQLWGGRTVPGLESFAHPWVVGIAAGIYFLETMVSFIYNFFTPSIPIDTVKETVKSFVTIPATALMVVLIGNAGQGSDLHSVVQAALVPDPMTAFYFFLGGSLGAMTQMLKIFVRSIIDLLPEPATNLVAELLEGAVSLAGILLIFYSPYVALVLSGLLIMTLISIGPRIYRATRMTYKAVFALFNYLNTFAETELFNPKFLDPKRSAMIEKNAPLNQSKGVVRIIINNLKGLKSNTCGYLVAGTNELYIICPGVLRTRTAHLKLKNLVKAEKNEGLLFDYINLRFPGEKVSLKLLKTWKSDFNFICGHLKIEAPALGGLREKLGAG